MLHTSYYEQDADFVEDDFEELYVRLRTKEGRIYTDEEVAKLPDVNSDNIHKKEWVVRKQSITTFIDYLKRKASTLNILEVGCGNGWFSAQLAKARDYKVVGVDVNGYELQQAKRVFNNLSNLHFVNVDLRKDYSIDMKFDVIVFAASIQYFSSLDEIIKIALLNLSAEGEIHILDSRLYNSTELSNAKGRSKLYFQSVGLPHLSSFYFHHSIDDLKKFNSKILYNPNLLWNKIFKNKSPFYWVRIQH